MASKTCLSYWFPKIEAAGIPVPKTEFVSIENSHNLCHLLDGKTPPEAERLAEWIAGAAGRLGYPAFLRTDMTSGKHSWKKTCCLTKDANVLSHIAAIVEFSECADFLGIPYDVWVVREWIKGKRICTCARYGDMPVCLEFRCFVQDSQVVCVHPYWPPGAIADGKPSDNQEWQRDHDAAIAAADMGAVRTVASAVGATLGGAWSVDCFYDDANGRWMVTDMAEAARSWHWPECPNIFT